jgi:IS5 family transposase
MMHHPLLVADQARVLSDSTSRHALSQISGLSGRTALLEQICERPEETTVHSDAGYDDRFCRAELTERGLQMMIF